MKYILLILGIAVIFTALYNNTDTSAHKIEDGKKILAFGDSLTYGYGASANESYPSVLSLKTGLKIINAGVNGETSEDGLRRLPLLLQDSDIKLMILCFGGNDILQKKPKSQLKTNLRQMIIMARSRGVETLLVSVPDIGLFGLSPLNLYDEVADDTGVVLLSGVLSDILGKPSLKSDQIHPNGAGYRVMADRIYDKLKEQGWISYRN